MVMKNWSAYLYESDFGCEPELRNKITAIWFTSLYDTLEAEARGNGSYYQGLLETCRAIGRPRLLHHCKKIENLCQGIRIFMDGYRVKEQIFIQDFRNQLVHGWQGNPLEELVTVKYVWKGRYKRRKVAWDCYHRVQRNLARRGHDSILAELFGPIWRMEPHFVRELLQLSNVHGNLDRLRREIFEGLE
jgi:hypothetical protein